MFELASIRYDRALVSGLSVQFGLIGFYVYAPSLHFDATARMFAPHYGIDEEAATGMAAGPLAAYLWEQGIRKERYRFEQGSYVDEPSPSLIHVDVEASDDRIERLFAGGDAYVSRKLSMELQP